jgi:glycerol-3-phosphate dehydrogenase
VPGEHIIDPWSAPLAYAHQGLAHGGKILRRCRVTGGDIRRALRWTLQTTLGNVGAGVVINAAGNHGDLVEAINRAEPPSPSRRARASSSCSTSRPPSCCTAIILPVPTERTKGVVACRTAFGNLLVGPTAGGPGRIATAREVDHAMLRQLIAKGVEMIPELAHPFGERDLCRPRPATQFKDYQIAVNRERRWITAAASARPA